ncbi:MAG: membrane protein insertase YidC [Bacilli bacterium]|nr:membrane protein insertase YidC [Bacilli bacterium]
MKKNKKLFIVVISLMFLLTGCTKQFKDADGKVVQDPTTKQTLVENILCRPVNLKGTYETAIEEKKVALKKLYEDGDLSKKEYKSKVDSLLNLEELPVCTEMSVIEGGYESIWTSIFVKPLAWLIIQLGKLVKNYGLAIILITVLIKIILFPLTYKSLKQSEAIKKVQPKLNKIEKKYAGKTDQESMMMKSNEMMALYKEHKINPMSGCLTSFLQIPIFFAFYEALYRLPLLFEGKFLGLHMGMTPLAAAGQGDWYYLILPLIVGLVTYFSFKMNKNGQPNDQMKQMNMMFNIMVVMIFITSFSMSVAIIIYWVVNSLLGIGQNLLIKKGSK